MIITIILNTNCAYVVGNVGAKSLSILQNPYTTYKTNKRKKEYKITENDIRKSNRKRIKN